jgi:hypothetical protein
VVEIALVSFFLLARHVVVEELSSLLGVVVSSVVADCKESLKSLQRYVLKVDVGFDLMDLVPCSFALPRGCGSHYSREEAVLASPLALGSLELTNDVLAVVV